MRLPQGQTVRHDNPSREPETFATPLLITNKSKGSPPPTRETSEEMNLLTLALSIEDVSNDRSSPRGESQTSLGEQHANLSISFPMRTRSPRQSLSPDHPLRSVEVAEPTISRGWITVRDLPNATPRPSPSPEPHAQPASEASGDLIRVQPETVDGPNSPATREGFDIPGFGDLSIQDEPMIYEVLDEPLPPGPFPDPDYQKALKSAKTLTRDIFQSLSHCKRSARPGTQLHKIKQRAEALYKSDNPASRTIGIVGDSAAGEDC